MSRGDGFFEFVQDNLFMFLVMFFIILGMIIIAAIIIQNKDALKPMMSGKCRVIEKHPSVDGIVKSEDIVVQFTNGQRLKLKNYKFKTTTVAVGDVGTVSYKGTTLHSFNREQY